MKKNKTIDILQEALRIFWLHDSGNEKYHLSERDLELILSAKDDTFNMSDAKRKELLNKLYDTVNGPSLGVLVTESMKAKGINNSKLSKETKLPIAVLKDLKEDRIYPNNIPLRLMQTLLSVLNVPIKAAETAFIKTFELIKRNISSPGMSIRGQVSYRKGVEGVESNLSKYRNRSRATGLFENRESLEKYIRLLKELISISEEKK